MNKSVESEVCGGWWKRLKRSRVEGERKNGPFVWQPRGSLSGYNPC